MNEPEDARPDELTMSLGKRQQDEPAAAVLRFGPGVPPQTQGAAAVWHGTLPEATVAKRPPAWRRYALAGLVLLAVLGFLAWQRLGEGLAVERVRVSTPRAGPGCDGTADVVGTVATNGRRGTITYRWARSDGTTSGLLSEDISRGQRTAELHLYWRFQGEGSVRASAELVITKPERRTAAVEFTYACAGP